jgi:hypothetical protein
MMKTRVFIAGLAALFLATGGPVSAAGVDYICGDIYSIVIESKDRTYESFDGSTGTTTTVFVPKGITIFNDESGDKWIVKTLPRDKRGKVVVRGKTCRKIVSG